MKNYFKVLSVFFLVSVLGVVNCVAETNTFRQRLDAKQEKELAGLLIDLKLEKMKAEIGDVAKLRHSKTSEERTRLVSIEFLKSFKKLLPRGISEKDKAKLVKLFVKKVQKYGSYSISDIDSYAKYKDQISKGPGKYMSAMKVLVDYDLHFGLKAFVEVFSTMDPKYNFDASLLKKMAKQFEKSNFSGNKTIDVKRLEGFAAAMTNAWIMGGETLTSKDFKRILKDPVGSSGGRSRR